MSVYLIPIENFEDFTFKLEKLKRKSLKYSNSLEYINHGIVLEKVPSPFFKNTPRPFYKVEVKGIVGIKGWEPVARITMLTNGENVITNLTCDFNVPSEYNHCKITCEHCGKNISRKFTYLLRNTETNELKQVGRTCVKDYTGIDVEDLALLETFEKTVSSYTADEYEPKTKFFNVREYARIVIALCEKNNGYYYKEENKNHKYTTIRTSITAYNVLVRGYSYSEYVDDMCKEIGEKLNDDKVSSVLDKCIEYVDNCDDENLKVCFYCDFSPFEFMSNIAELVFKFYKDADEVVEEVEPLYEFYGKVGDKFELDVKDFEKVGEFSTNFGYYNYVTTYIYAFKYENVLFKWMTSKIIDNIKTLKIKGTIKAHNTFKNARETIVTRCKIL